VPLIGIETCPGKPSLKQGPWTVIQVTVSTDHGSWTLEFISAIRLCAVVTQ